MPMNALAIDDFPKLMNEWVNYVIGTLGVGHSDATTIWRAMLGPGTGEFKSRPPAGLAALETYGPLRRLVEAMSVLEQDSDAKPELRCLQATYLVGPEQAMVLCRKTRTKLYEGCRTAEKLLRVEMKRH